VIISFFIASPVAWYFVNRWLQSFAYRAPFSVWIMVLAWASTFFVALLTISIQAVKGALSNPVENLRTE
jgi:putative ABC transport system permease protein